MASNDYRELPLVYSCSGCSSVAQLANRLALELDREQVAEMSCIAGVGGGVPSLVKKAQSGRKIIALDGCALRCVQNCLTRAELAPDQHYLLTDYGLKKTFHADYSEADAERLKTIIIDDITRDAGQAEHATTG